MFDPTRVTFWINTLNLHTVSHKTGAVSARRLSLLVGVVHYELKKYFSVFIKILITVKVKVKVRVKQSRYRPVVAQRVPGS